MPPDRLEEPHDGYGMGGAAPLRLPLERLPCPHSLGERGGRSEVATKDKNTKKSMEKKPAQKTLKEKRQAKRDKLG
jgi:hypothetical protein